MKYFYYDPSHGRLGPFTFAELLRLHLAGAIQADTAVTPEGADAALPFGELLPGRKSHHAASASTAPPPLPQSPPSPMDESFAERAGADLRVMLPHLFVPFAELKSFRWLENRKALAIASVGLLPLIIYAAFGEPRQIANAFWAIALYFSALWALFFYYVFPTPEAKASTVSICFFGTGLLSISVLLQLYRVWPLSSILPWTSSGNLFTRWMGFILGVGVPEEVCKTLVLFFIARRLGPFTPQTMLFYGLMAGLGFGIYEGVDYQWRRNPLFSRGLGEYYLLNLLRLTTLPFLHAIWTGIAGYFIGFAERFPERQRGLLIVAIGLPALLHGTYNTFSSAGSAFSVLIALVSVLALNLYLAKSVEFEKLLVKQKAE